jgi:pSer/pThr/pTyr-binding forkhead associated (FHA) protein
VRFEIQILQPEGGPSVPLGETPIRVGRGPGNEVVLGDDSVSWHHAQLWAEGEAAWVRDLGSRNGTFVNGERAQTSVRLAHGDVLRIGAKARLKVAAFGERQSPVRTRHVHDLDTGVRVLVHGERLHLGSAQFHVGSAPGSDLRIEDWPERAATIVLHANGEIWVSTDAGEWQVELGAPFEVRGRRFAVVEEHTDHAPTIEIGAQGYPYIVNLVTSGQTPQVSLLDPATGRELLLTGNRGVLLYALCRQLAKDRASGRSEAEQGWCTTDDVLVAVWGRGQKDPNPLNVLVHRLRGYLTEEGFDPWFVEKRRGAIRVRLREVTER